MSKTDRWKCSDTEHCKSTGWTTSNEEERPNSSPKNSVSPSSCESQPRPGCGREHLVNRSRRQRHFVELRALQVRDVKTPGGVWTRCCQSECPRKMQNLS